MARSSSGPAPCARACRTRPGPPATPPARRELLPPRRQGPTSRSAAARPTSGRSFLNGQDIGPRRAFGCLGMLGDSGCGIEGTLEAARRALSADDSLSANRGFLRSDSVLSVVFLTDEDDCSVLPMRRSQNDPTVRDCRTPDKGPLLPASTRTTAAWPTAYCVMKRSTQRARSATTGGGRARATAWSGRTATWRRWAATSTSSRRCVPPAGWSWRASGRRATASSL